MNNLITIYLLLVEFDDSWKCNKNRFCFAHRIAAGGSRQHFTITILFGSHFFSSKEKSIFIYISIFILLTVWSVTFIPHFIENIDEEPMPWET